MCHECGTIYVVGINPAKLAAAATLGAIVIPATAGDATHQIRHATRGKGVDVGSTSWARRRR